MIKLREWYGSYEVDGKEREIIVVIAPEYNVILGWDFDKFKQKTGLTRLIHRCPIPIDGQVLGMSIPAFIKGTDLALPRRAKFIRPHKISVYFGKEIPIERGLPYSEIADEILRSIWHLSC